MYGYVTEHAITSSFDVRVRDICMLTKSKNLAERERDEFQRANFERKYQRTKETDAREY